MTRKNRDVRRYPNEQLLTCRNWPHLPYFFHQVASKVTLFVSHITFSLVQKGSESLANLSAAFPFLLNCLLMVKNKKKSEQFDKLMEYHA